jgi:hypothetical protein
MSARQSSVLRPASICPTSVKQTRPRPLPAVSSRIFLPYIEPCGGRCGSNGELTKPSLLNLLRCKGEDRQKFNHDFDDDICHLMGGRNPGINSETLKEIADTLEEVKESVIT